MVQNSLRLSRRNFWGLKRVCQATPLPVDCPAFVQIFMVAVASQSVKTENLAPIEICCTTAVDSHKGSKQIQFK